MVKSLVDSPESDSSPRANRANMNANRAYVTLKEPDEMPLETCSLRGRCRARRDASLSCHSARPRQLAKQVHMSSGPSTGRDARISTAPAGSASP
jgi:hypothetical protein